MKRLQWITVGLALFLVIGLYAATQQQLFGERKRQISVNPQAAGAGLSIDSLLAHAKEHLTPEQVTRLNFLENSVSRGDVKEQKLHIYHQLAKFWLDTVRFIEPKEWFEPYAWYTAEAARLENSEKSLTFAARLFWNSLQSDAEATIRTWRAQQAKDLYERSLKLAPANDSLRVELGEVNVYGGIALPMEGIGMIRQVAEKNPGNAYAQMALGRASVASGQLEKAVERFEQVASLEPSNLEAVLMLADTYERMEQKEKAQEWYRKSLPLIREPKLKKEVEVRITQLSK